MIMWRRVVQAYPCLVCGASPGTMCITKSGRFTYTPHYLRSREASEGGWRDPDDQVVEHVGHSPKYPSDRREEW